jgi:hypothetical protein
MLNRTDENQVLVYGSLSEQNTSTLGNTLRTCGECFFSPTNPNRVIQYPDSGSDEDRIGV